ncbi:MAG TPA: hypothetical protein VGC57_06710 [Cellulomonas sp.]
MDHADLPLTTTATGTPERRVLGALALAAAVAVSLSACSGIAADLTGRAASQVRTASFESGAAAKQHHALPDWVPDDATGLRQSVRTTGEEQILVMRADPGDLPDTCTPVGPDNPLVPHPVAGDGSDPSDYRTVSTIRADWWPVEIEQGATLICDGWWVAVEDGSLYGFTPERRTVPVN